MYEPSIRAPCFFFFFSSGCPFSSPRTRTQYPVRVHDSISLLNSLSKFPYSTSLFNSLIQFPYLIPLFNFLIKFHYLICLSNPHNYFLFYFHHFIAARSQHTCPLFFSPSRSSSPPRLFLWRAFAYSVRVRSTQIARWRGHFLGRPFLLHNDILAVRVRSTQYAYANC